MLSNDKLQSVLRLHGSQWRLAGRIIREFPRGFERMAYVKVFGGSGAVLALKPDSRVEFYNDLDGELVSFWKQLRFHPNELARTLRLMPYSCQEFNSLKMSYSIQPTELLRAAAYVYCSMASIYGLMGSFGRYGTWPGNSLAFVGRKIRRLTARYRNVILENLPFEQLIRSYDSPNTLFYCDPPYPGHAGYRLKFSPEDFGRLLKLLRGIEGKAIISSAVDQWRNMAGFFRKKIAVSYTTTVGRRTNRMEILAKNWGGAG